MATALIIDPQHKKETLVPKLLSHRELMKLSDEALNTVYTVLLDQASDLRVTVGIVKAVMLEKKQNARKSIIQEWKTKKEERDA